MIANPSFEGGHANASRRNLPRLVIDSEAVAKRRQQIVPQKIERTLFFLRWKFFFQLTDWLFVSRF
jgi:hypothetical protein